MLALYATCQERKLSRQFVCLDANRAHPDLNQGPADLQSAALTTELCTQTSGIIGKVGLRPQRINKHKRRKTVAARPAFQSLRGIL